MNFVVGVPHFLHTDFLAPLAVGQVIRAIGASVAPREVMSQIANTAIFSNADRSEQSRVTDRAVAPGGREVREALGNLPPMEGPGGADFTVYTKKDLTVRRGEKAVVTLFTRRITFSHLYRWSPPEALRHYHVLKNTTDSAWTTGTGFVLLASWYTLMRGYLASKSIAIGSLTHTVPPLADTSCKDMNLYVGCCKIIRYDARFAV